MHLTAPYEHPTHRAPSGTPAPWHPRHPTHVIRLLAIDVDGTLLDSRGRIPQDNLDALTAAVGRGTQLVIVTGRSYSFALPAVVPLPDPLLMIVHNGAIARVRSGETVLRRLLPRDSARAVLAATLDWRSSALLYFDRAESRQILTDRLDWTHPNRARFRDRNRDIIEEVAALEGALDEDPIQLAFNGELLPMRDVVTTLTRHPLAADLSVSVTEYPHRDFSLDRRVRPRHDERSDARARRRDARHCSRRSHGGRRQPQRSRHARVGRRRRRDGERRQKNCESLGLEVTGTNDECGLAAAVRSTRSEERPSFQTPPEIPLELATDRRVRTLRPARNEHAACAGCWPPPRGQATSRPRRTAGAVKNTPAPMPRSKR